MNSSHRPGPYFEWFYFHFASDDGAAINLVLHETDIFGLRHEPYLSMSILEPGREPRYLRRDLAGVLIATGQPYLEVGEAMVIETTRAILLNIDLPGQGSFSAEITKLAPPLVFDDGILYKEPWTGRLSHWIVQVPHATFTAIMQLDGTVRRLHGMAYQDHQWGTILIQDFVSDWVWGHFSNERVAVVFFQILTQYGRLIERVALLTADGVFTGTALETNYLNTLFLAEQPEWINEVATVAFLYRQFQTFFDVAPANLMRSRISEFYGRTRASYLRWSATATLEMGCVTQPLHGISEYIRIRPAIYGELSDS